MTRTRKIIEEKEEGGKRRRKRRCRTRTRAKKNRKKENYWFKTLPGLPAWIATRADEARTGSYDFFQSALIPSIFVAETRQNVRIRTTEDFGTDTQQHFARFTASFVQNSWKWAPDHH